MNYLSPPGTALSDPVTGDISTRELLYDGHNILGRLFTANPLAIFGAMCLASLIGLLAFAWMINVLVIESHGKRHGIASALNWSLMYTVLLPAIFAVASSVSHYVRQSLRTLCSQDLPIFLRKDGSPATNFPSLVAADVRKRAVVLTAICIWLVVIITVADTWNLWVGFYQSWGPWAQTHTAIFPPSRMEDWDTAFRLRDSSTYANPPTIVQNLAFDIVAYLFQGTAIYLGLFFVGTFLVFLAAFSRRLRTTDEACRFKMLEGDPYLGLFPMAKVFDGFLLIGVLFQVYGLFHRLQLAGRVAPYHSTWDYILFLFKDPKQWQIIGDPQAYAFNSLDAGMYLLFVFLGVPLIIICFLPLFRIRNFVNAERERRLNIYSADRSAARARVDKAEDDRLTAQITLLDGANIWPNGDKKAKAFLAIMVILALGTIGPPLLVPLVALGIVAGVVKALVSVVRPT